MLLWVIIATGVIGWLIGKNGKKSDSEVEQGLSQRNREWYEFVASYKKIASNKEEKHIISRMLSDIKKQGLVGAVSEAVPWQQEEQSEALENDENLNIQEVAEINNYETTEIGDVEQQQAIQPQEYEEPDNSPPIEIDNTSLLLYFGAFLFVASVGLFVAFSGLGGALKALAVLAVAITLYALGCWLYKNKERFTQVGVAFAGIGLAIIPLVGLAAYKYIYGESNGALVWFLTSILAMGVYTHALWYFRKPLLNYVFIFTLLSLFESAVSISSTPIYYFGWAMALVGIGVTAFSLFKNIWPEFKEAAAYSGQLMVPLSVLISAFMIPNQGAIQMGISLLLAAAFYGLQAKVSTDDVNRYSYMVMAHAFLLAAIASIAYGAKGDWLVTAWVMLVANALQLIAATVWSYRSTAWVNYLYIVTVSLLAGVAMSIKNPGLLFVSVGLLSVAAYIIWQKIKQLEFYVISILSLMTLPFILGMYWQKPILAWINLALMTLVGLVVQVSIYIIYNHKNEDENWPMVAKTLIILSSIAVIITAIFATPAGFLLVSLLLCATVICSYLSDHDQGWLIFIGVILVLPVIKSWEGGGVIFALSVILAVTLNAVVGFGRQSFNRYMSVFVALLLPIAASRLRIGSDWDAEIYSIAYLVLSLIFIGLRWLTNRTKDIVKINSSSFELAIGYIVAAMGSIIASVIAQDSQLLTLVLLTLTIVSIVIALYVEKMAILLNTVVVLSLATITSSIFIETRWWTLVIALGLAAVSWLISTLDKTRHWPIMAGVYVVIPALRYWFDGLDFVLATSIALAVNIIVALAYRSEINRWIGSFLWMIMPLALGDGWLNHQQGWSARAYAVAYLVTMAGFMIARAIARGVILISSKVPMASYAKNASMSYVTGYVLAAFASVTAAIYFGNNIFLSLVILVIAAASVICSLVIEKEKTLLGVVPVLLQFALYAAFASIASTEKSSVIVFTSLSILLALLGYVLSLYINDKKAREAIEQSSLFCSVIAPASALMFGTVWTMPVGVIIAGLTLAHKYRNVDQNSREAAGVFILIGVMWLMHYLGLRNIQSYTHIVAALFAAYAYWRYARSEKDQSDAYIIAALALTTIPLVLQAMAGAAGGLYGWWLLIEQVIFMIIGMSIGSKLMTRWGLYVAVAAVLYQLRDLGWAALSFLAIFVIGVAIYKIQKTDKKN